MQVSSPVRAHGFRFQQPSKRDRASSRSKLRDSTSRKEDIL